MLRVADFDFVWAPNQHMNNAKVNDEKQRNCAVRIKTSELFVPHGCQKLSMEPSSSGAQFLMQKKRSACSLTALIMHVLVVADSLVVRIEYLDANVAISVRSAFSNHAALLQIQGLGKVQSGVFLGHVLEDSSNKLQVRDSSCQMIASILA